MKVKAYMKRLFLIIVLLSLITLLNTQNTYSWYINKIEKSYITLSLSYSFGISSSKTYNIDSINSLNEAILKYPSGSTININTNIDYYGDLIFLRPVNLYINNATLSIHGDLVFSYSGNGSFILDTSRSGKIITLCHNDYGGRCYFDIPNSNLNIIGKGESGINNGDIYIQKGIDNTMRYNGFFVNCNLNNGLVIDMSSIYTYNFDNGSLTSSNKLYDINLYNNSKIIISDNTEIGDIYVLGNEINNRSIIINYGIIDNIHYEYLDYDFDINGDVINYLNPSIYLENYNLIRNNIYLKEYANSSNTIIYYKEDIYLNPNLFIFVSGNNPNHYTLDDIIFK